MSDQCPHGYRVTDADPTVQACIDAHARAAAFVKWCEVANYADDDRDAPHCQAFYAGFYAGLLESRAREPEAVPPLKERDQSVASS